MRIKEIKIKDIVGYLGNRIVNVCGDIEDRIIDNLSDADHVKSTTLDWVNSSKCNKSQIAEESKAECVIVDETVEYSDKARQLRKIYIVVKNPRDAMSLIAGHFFIDKASEGIHPSAIVDSSANVSPSASVGAGCVIGKATIGPGTVLMPNVVVYNDVRIGANCLIQAGAVIGTDGLGCSRDENGRLLKFPHLGGVVIGDNVEIGANCQIARGVLSDTVIEDGCKINGLCFIAHNGHLGENVWITGDTMLCGSVHVGKNTTIFSNVIVRDQKQIGESCKIGMGAVVTKDVHSGETWVGNPAKKIDK